MFTKSKEEPFKDAITHLINAPEWLVGLLKDWFQMLTNYS